MTSNIVLPLYGIRARSCCGKTYSHCSKTIDIKSVLVKSYKNLQSTKNLQIFWPCFFSTARRHKLVKMIGSLLGQVDFFPLFLKSTSASKARVINLHIVPTRSHSGSKSRATIKLSKQGQMWIQTFIVPKLFTTEL